MVQTLEAIRGGGGSVKVGTTGTISALMSREIESAESATKLPSPNTTLSNSANDITPRKLKSKTSINEPGSSNAKNDKCPESVRKTKHHTGRTNRIPMLAADNMSVDGTPIRQKPFRRGPTGVVEIVDIKCGNNSITNRLKKLGFSKLSDSMG